MDGLDLVREAEHGLIRHSVFGGYFEVVDRVGIVFGGTIERGMLLSFFFNIHVYINSNL